MDNQGVSEQSDFRPINPYMDNNYNVRQPNYDVRQGDVRPPNYDVRQANYNMRRQYNTRQFETPYMSGGLPNIPYVKPPNARFLNKGDYVMDQDTGAPVKLKRGFVRDQTGGPIIVNGKVVTKYDKNKYIKKGMLIDPRKVKEPIINPLNPYSFKQNNPVDTANPLNDFDYKKDSPLEMNNDTDKAVNDGETAPNMQGEIMIRNEETSINIYQRPPMMGPPMGPYGGPNMGVLVRPKKKKLSKKEKKLLMQQKEQESPYKRRGHPWERPEEEQIREELKEGKTIQEISDIHERSPKSIEKHIYKMAIAYLEKEPEKDKDDLCEEYKISITRLNEILLKIERAKNKKEKAALKEIQKKKTVIDVSKLTDEIVEVKKDMKDLLKILLQFKINDNRLVELAEKYEDPSIKFDTTEFKTIPTIIETTGELIDEVLNQKNNETDNKEDNNSKNDEDEEDTSDDE